MFWQLGLKINCLSAMGSVGKLETLDDSALLERQGALCLKLSPQNH
jgi:hypothetical protein